MSESYMEHDGAFTIKDFCEWAGVGRTFAYDLLNSGKINGIKAGGRTLILKASAREWLGSLPTIAAEKKAA
jgi:excisionase family DNA binding protein